MKATNRKFSIAVALIMLAVIIAAGFGVPDALCAGSHATLQGTYGDTDAASLWYYGEDALNIAGAKAEIAKWDKKNLDVNDPVIVAVLDAGIDVNHDLYKDMLLKNQQGEVMGYNAVTGGTQGNVDIQDRTNGYHGSSVTGIIAMTLKELGLSDYVKIYPIKVTNDNSNNGIGLDAVVRALARAVEIGADVINMSFGLHKSDMTSTDWTSSADLRYAIGSASENALLVAAAGNENKDSADAKNLFYPAAFDNVLSVVNYYKTSNGSLGVDPESNYGDAYDIAAPGKDIYTAGAYVGGATYHNLSGTSASAAFVSAAGALLSLRLRAEGRQNTSGMDVARILKNFKGSASVTKGTCNYACLDYLTLLTQELSETEYEFATPTAIALSHNGPMGSGDFKGSIYMPATQVTPIEFIASVLPYGRTDPLWNERVEWYLLDSQGSETSLGTGSKLTYEAEKFGDTKLVARLRIGNATIEASQRIYIRFSDYYVGNFRVTYAEMANESDVHNVPTSGVLYTTETVEFSATSLRFLDDSVEVKWFVNGQYVASGRVFRFRPTVAGTYRISAQYGDNARVEYDGYAFKATVKSFIVKPVNLAVLIVFIVIAVVVIAVAVTLVALHKQQKKAVDTHKSDDQLPV